MSDVKKWNLPRGATISESPDGEFVLASDYAALEAELAKLRAGQEPVAFKKPSLLMDCNVRYSTSTTPQPSAVPGLRHTDQWESARVADYNAGWNARHAADFSRLSDEQIFDIAEPFGEFRYGDAQGDKRLAFARAIIAAVLASPSAPSTVQGDALPYWEPCNPGCDPELNGHRDRHCRCEAARAAIDAARKEGGEV